MLLKNRFTKFVFDDYNGRLLEVANAQTGTIYLNGVNGTGCTYIVDTGTADMWDSRPDAPTTVRISCAQTPAHLTLERDTEGQTLRIEQTLTVEGRGEIEVCQVIFLKDDTPLAQYTHSFINKCQNAVVVSVETLPLEGFIGDDVSVMWPEREGALFRKVFQERKQARNDCFYRNILLQREDKDCVNDHRRVGNYPSPFFSQFVSFYHQNENLYYGIHDEDSALKQFVIERARRFFVTLWPFAEPGKAVVFAPVHLGCIKGDWHAAGDVYRSFLVNESTMIRQNRPLGKRFYGMLVQRVSTYPDIYHMHYSEDCDYPTELAAADMQTRCLNSGTFGIGRLNSMPACSRYGREHSDVPVTLFIGWHKGGLDALFPDYEFLDEMGGEEGMRKGLKAIHDEGSKAMFYVNVHIAESQSKWFNQPNPQGGINGEACAVRQDDGSDLSETYDTTFLHFVSMCPMAEAWQDALVSAMERLRRCGADGIYFDQLMEMNAVLCYNRKHGHSTPATAYHEGYKKLLTRIETMFQKYGDDYIFGCEGCCDAYMRHVDVAGMNWRRRIDSAKVPHLYPQVIRYCMPMHILGMQGHGEIGSALSARSFSLGEPLLTFPYVYELARRHRALCDKYPEIYFDGRFMDTLGIAGLAEGIRAGVIVSADGKQADIRLYNAFIDPIETLVQISPAGWGAPEGNFLVTDAEDDQVIAGQNGVYSVNIASKTVRILHVSVE